jgi:hypothetical protein
MSFEPQTNTVDAKLREADELLFAARSRLRSRQEEAAILRAPSEVADAAYRSRRMRDQIFGEDAAVFGEPAWDILLDLYLAHLSRREISISSACIASAGPTTTGLRYLDLLQKRGLVARHADLEDRRRVFVSLTMHGHELMNAWARTGSDK